MDCEICGSRNAKRKAKVENAVLRVCDNCVKLGEELPIFVENEKLKQKKLIKIKKKSRLTMGDVIEVG